MAYQIYQFDDVMLPVYNSEQEHTPGERESSLRNSVGGVFDYDGTFQRYPRRMTVDLRGWFVGQQAYEVDASGNYIVDHNGNNIVTHTAAVDLRVQVEALQRKIGHRASLWRRWTSDNTIMQWKTARLLRAPYPQNAEDGCTVAEMDAVFETSMAGWHGETQITASASVNSNTGALTVRNRGSMRIDDATIEMAASGSDITSVTITYPAAGIDLRYTGTITDGQTVTIDCGAGTVRNDSNVDKYSNFALGANHTARGWLPLEPGSNAIMAEVTGQGTISIKHYNQWP